VSRCGLCEERQSEARAALGRLQPHCQAQPSPAAPGGCLKESATKKGQSAAQQ